MACRKAFDVDLVACLLDRDRPEWQAFRDHYPTCPECAAEVRTWTELQAELPPAHPEPDRLLSLEDRPASLPPEERHALHEHVRTCVACRDELETLRSTDIPALVRAGTAVAAPLSDAPLSDAPLSDAPPPSASEPPRRRGGALFGWVRRLVVRPAFAYGVALALLIPALAPYVDLGERSEFAMLERSPAPAPSQRSGPDLSPRARALRDELRGAPAVRPATEMAQLGLKTDARAIRAEARAPAPTEPEAARDRSTDGDQPPPVAAAVATPGPAAAGGAARMAAALEADAVAAHPAGRVPAKQSADEADGWRRVTLSPGDARTVTAGAPGVVLAISLPASAAHAGLAELRVRDASGRRELREQYFGPPAQVVEIRVPGTWLVPGRYTVTLHTGADEAMSIAALDVQVPAP